MPEPTTPHPRSPLPARRGEGEDLQESCRLTIARTRKNLRAKTLIAGLFTGWRLYCHLGIALLAYLIAIGASSPLFAAPVPLKASYKVRTERAVMIPTRDGKRLSGDVFRPDAEGRFPVIIMYHPYRKDDVGRGGVGEHFYFAERGLASVRLDARGTGHVRGRQYG